MPHHSLLEITSHELIARLQDLKIQPRTALVLGSSLETLTHGLLKTFPDLTLSYTPQGLKTHTQDMILLHHTLTPDNSERTLSTLAPWLAANGIFLFALQGDTQDLHQLGDALIAAGFVDPVVDRQIEITDQGPIECLYGLAYGPKSLTESPVKHGRSQISLEAMKALLKKQGYQEGTPSC